MSTSVDQYVGQRALLLANLVLTRRKDVSVHALGEDDLGIDLIARVSTPVMKGLATPSFGVNVMGTSRALGDEETATRYANQRWKRQSTKGQFLFPIVILLFSMEGDEGYFSWLLEPCVPKEHGPTLTRLSPLQMTKINKKALDEIVNRVVTWFEAMAEMLSKHAAEK